MKSRKRMTGDISNSSESKESRPSEKRNGFRLKQIDDNGSSKQRLKEKDKKEKIESKESEKNSSVVMSKSDSVC